jgi:hypothetical protein
MLHAARGVLLFFFCILFVHPPLIAQAAQAKLELSSLSSEAEGHRIYQRVQGQAYDYDKPVWSGRARNCIIKGLTEGVTYFFVARSYTNDTESTNSNEIIITPGTVDSDRDGIENDLDPDDDNDGMPDQWEEQHGLNPEFDDTWLDQDGDGLSNSMEYQMGSDPCQTVTGKPPWQPEITYPFDADRSVALNAVLAADSNDPDYNDSHQWTQWLIQRAGDQQIVMDVTTHGNALNTMTVPDLVLQPQTDYVCQVRFFDQNGDPSEWSAPSAFTTAGEDNGDANVNGVPDDQEPQVEADFDGDGYPEYQQQEAIKVLKSTTGDGQMAVRIATGPNDAARLIAASVRETAPENWPDTGAALPMGVLAYKIQVEFPGQYVDVDLLTSQTSSMPDRWIRYTSTAGFVEFGGPSGQDSHPGTSLLLRDGGPEDADGAANGWIVDICAPVREAAADSGTHSGPLGAGGGGGGGCFIGSLVQ